MPSSPATRNAPPIGAATASRTPTPRELFDLGLAFNARKQHQKALESFDLAIQLQPDFFEAHGNRGAMLAALGRHQDAIESYRNALAIKPNFADAHCNLGSALTHLQRYDEALASLDRALALRPNNPDALYNRGNALKPLKRFEEALASYDCAIALQPDHADAHNNRGQVLRELEKYDEALASYDRALALRPNNPDALYNRGNALKPLRRFEEALASYDCAIALQPDHADAHNNRGQVLRELERYDEALASYDRALALRPQHIMAHCNAAALRLLTGDFERGWVHYEWRWMKNSVIPLKRNFSQPAWNGGDPIAGKTILVHSEQGLGDTIQFCRYVPLLATHGARVIFEVQKTLQTLMTLLGDAPRIVPKGDPLPAFDLHCPLVSLPLAFGTRLETIPSANGYLSAPAQRMTTWQSRLQGQRHPRIGLVWSGNPGHERDRERSVGLREFLPLLDALGDKATFVSLQKDVRAEDAAFLKARADILDYGNALKDFSDTAALISQLDLVISVDTSVAHLAGAIGKPVWILLTYFPDWRWLLGRDDSPWYPTARLFRQDESRTWGGVTVRVCQALRQATT